MIRGFSGLDYCGHEIVGFGIHARHHERSEQNVSGLQAQVNSAWGTAPGK